MKKLEKNFIKLFKFKEIIKVAKATMIIFFFKYPFLLY